MRWDFVDPKQDFESTERATIIERIAAWWHEFEGKTDSLSDLFSQKARWDLPAWMDAHLQPIDPQLMWEFGPAVRGSGHRLVITPENAHHLRPLVRAILARAPQTDGWEFYDGRLAEDVAQAMATVEGRTGCDIADFQVRVARGANQRIDLTYASPSIAQGDDATALNAAFVATESILGEPCLNEWIGAIEATAMPRRGGLESLFGGGRAEMPGFIGLERLKDTVDALRESMREQLPASPHCDWVEQAEWTLWKLEPQSADDYCEQHDLQVGKSANPPLWQAAHADRLFSSQRFSRCGEKFCYVKLDGSAGLPEDGFADKSEIEDALDSLLKPGRLGCQIGGGTGLRYSYIDLALTDVEKAIPAIQDRLRAGRVPNRSWIQFYDYDLATEWIGIYDDSPPPPMAVNG